MSVIDLNGIKENIQTLFQNNNTTTSSIKDLSSGMVNRVSQILKTHIERLPIQASMYPAVTVFYDQKSIETETIAKNQSTGKRKCTLDAKIAGAVWNNTYLSVDEDPADEDLENLMENIEEILRSDYNLSGKVLIQKPTNVTYHNVQIAEETHMRVGIINLECEVFY